jgi:hypothetical protein
MRPTNVTTDEWWEVNGVPLNTLAYNITTWGQSRLSPPPLRGSNIVVPGLPGQIYSTKTLDSNQIVLSFWVQGCNPDGSVPTTKSPKQTFDKNFLMLRRLFIPSAASQITLTKHWIDYDTGVAKTASAQAQYTDGLEPTMTGRARAVFSVSLNLADPLFYDSAPVNLPAITTQSSTSTVVVPGDWETSKITVNIAGPRVNPTFTITRPDGTVVKMTYSDTLVAGETATIDVANFDGISHNSDGTTVESAGYVSHSGHVLWLSLMQGSNTIAVNSSSGTGSISISYVPVWF